MGFDCIICMHLLPSHCDFFFLFGYRMSFFGRLQSLLLAFQQLVVISLFLWEKVSSKSAILFFFLSEPLQLMFQKSGGKHSQSWDQLPKSL